MDRGTTEVDGAWICSQWDAAASPLLDGEGSPGALRAPGAPTAKRRSDEKAGRSVDPLSPLAGIYGLFEAACVKCTLFINIYESFSPSCKTKEGPAPSSVQYLNSCCFSDGCCFQKRTCLFF